MNYVLECLAKDGTYQIINFKTMKELKQCVLFHWNEHVHDNSFSIYCVSDDKEKESKNTDGLIDWYKLMLAVFE